MSNAKQSEIWIVNLDPTIGSEIKKSRPAVIVSSNSIGKLPLKLVSPITKWKDYFEGNIWHVKLLPEDTNGLSEISAIDVLQTRCVDTARLTKKIGIISGGEFNDIIFSLNAIIKY